MRLHPFAVLVALAASTAIAPTGAEARPRPTVAPHRVAHRHRAVASRAVTSGARVPYGYIDSGPEDPRYGYEEAPYDPNYHGPSAEVFAATKAEARDSGLLHELAPDAKVSATGVVVGGGL